MTLALIFFAFILGLVIESFLLSSGKKYKEIITVFIIASVAILITVLRSFLERGTEIFQIANLSFFLFLFCLTYSVAFGFILKKEILKPINETSLLFWNLVFLLIFLDNFKIFSLFALIILVPSTLIIIIAYSNKPIKIAGKVFLYSWFLFILLIIAIKSLSPEVLLNTFSNPLAYSPFFSFVIGMSSLYIFVHFWFLFWLIPIPGKNQSFRSRMREWHQDTRLMASKFSDQQSNFFTVTFMLTIFLSLAFIVVYFDSLYLPFLLNFLIASSSLLKTGEEK